MTQQNVVIPGAQTAPTVAAASHSSVSPARESPAGDRNLNIPGNLPQSNLEGSYTSAKMKTVVESMRACSPTRKGKGSSLSEEHVSWKMEHPSALDMFEKIIKASKGKKIVMFLDYDGTLSPIVDDPDRAFMSSAMRATVRKLARYFPTAIVSGRCRDKVYNFVRLAELYYAGSHGMDIKGPSKGSNFMKGAHQGLLFQPASEFLPMIDEVSKALLENIRSVPGATVENNKFCASVHFRCVEEKKWGELAKQVGSVLKEYPKLRLSQGRKVLEIRPIIKWDKGRALEFLLESLGYANSTDAFPIYIGDDRTDEDAFKVLRERGQGFGILVTKTPKDTHASYSLQEPSEVMAFLRRLVELRKMGLRRQCRLRRETGQGENSAQK
ncbi:unnamed protein product [Cuscuta europaea]|uniref:Trehalose 6-phosphate phosphatase n=1 Tax=Cuscuta europaea TaxID=41803 RepID=A0A9P1EIP4_CUSEU|nr:unnamed protein product [Cuscuta europaea]